MRKKMTKLLSYALAGVVTLTSIVAVPLGALADEPIEPEILFYRDFEDYTGGSPIGNTNNDYGTWGIQGTSTWDAYTKAESVDGIGFYVTSSNYSSNHAAFPDMTDGTLYVAFDEIPGEEPKETSVYFKSGTPNFAFSYKPGEAWTATDRNWGYDQKTAMLGSGQNHRIELVIDPATGDAKRYINGNYIGIKNIGITTGLTEMLLRFSATSIVDNLAVVHYPENVVPQTFSLAKAEADEKADVFRVFLKSDAVDSDGKGTSAKSAISAPYGITLPSTDANNTSYTPASDSFSVDGMNVSSVSRGTRAGEYIVGVDGDIKSGESYTITANPQLNDILGSTLNQENGSKTIAAAAPLTATVSGSGSDVVVTFNDEIINPAEYAKGGTIKNVYTGETGEVTLTGTSATTVAVNGDVEAGDEYILTLPADIRGKNGNTLHSTEVYFNTGTSNCLKKLGLVDIQGTFLDLKDINPSGIENLSFEFTDNTAAENAVITVTDKGGASLAEGTDYTKNISGSKVAFALSKILAPAEEYTVSITGIAKAYSIKLNTEEAKLERLPVLFLDANGQKLETVEKGDTVKVRLDFVNSTDTAKTFLASASMFDGLEMTGFAHKEVTMEPLANGGTGKHTEVFTFVATEDGVGLNCYMWSMNEGKFAPIQTVERFK